MSITPFIPISPTAQRVEDAECQTVAGNMCTKVITSLPSEPTSKQWMRFVEMSSTLDFWNNPEEDISTAEDGEPLP